MDTSRTPSTLGGAPRWREGRGGDGGVPDRACARPALVQTERTYDQVNALMREIGDARVWAVLHWRHAVRHGEQIGRRVAAHVTRHYFQPER